jgi:hypothetical protein
MINEEKTEVRDPACCGAGTTKSLILQVLVTPLCPLRIPLRPLRENTFRQRRKG